MNNTKGREEQEAENLFSAKYLEHFHPDGYDPEFESEPEAYKSAKRLEQEYPEAAKDFMDLVNITDIEEAFAKVSELNEKYQRTENNVENDSLRITYYELSDWGLNKSGAGGVKVKVTNRGIVFGISRY